MVYYPFLQTYQAFSKCLMCPVDYSSITINKYRDPSFISLKLANKIANNSTFLRYFATDNVTHLYINFKYRNLKIFLLSKIFLFKQTNWITHTNTLRGLKMFSQVVRRFGIERFRHSPDKLENKKSYHTKQTQARFSY